MVTQQETRGGRAQGAARRGRPAPQPKHLDVTPTVETRRLSDERVAELVLSIRPHVTPTHTPRIDLDDATVNDLAIRARAGDEMCRELVIYWSNRLIAPHPQHVQWLKFATAGPEDMWQEGREQVLVAIEKYDPSRGYNFGAYAARVVSNALGEWAERHSLTIPATRNARRRLRREGVVDETTQRAKAAEFLPRYLSTIISSNEDGEEAPDEAGESIAERPDAYNLEESVERNETAKRVRAAFYALHPDLQQVLYCRVVEDLPREKTSRLLHLSMAKLRALEDEALGFLEGLLEEYMADAAIHSDPLEE